VVSSVLIAEFQLFRQIAHLELEPPSSPLNIANYHPQLNPNPPMALIRLSFNQEQFLLDLLYDSPKIIGALLLSLFVVGSFIVAVYFGGAIVASALVGTMFLGLVVLYGYTYFMFLYYGTGQEETHPPLHPPVTHEEIELGEINWPNRSEGEEGTGEAEGRGSDGLTPSGGSVE